LFEKEKKYLKVCGGVRGRSPFLQNASGVMKGDAKKGKGAGWKRKSG